MIDLENISAEQIEEIRKVGKASTEAILYAASLVKEGASLLEVADGAEKFLKDRGFSPAFPLNISVNEQAAHYTPSMGDQKRFAKDDLVKIDFGAEKDGLLGDGAITVDLSGRHSKMVESAERALDAAIGLVRHGVSVCDIGKAINQSVESDGFVTVKNLGGHGVGVHDLHAELFIPNYDNYDFTALEEGMVIAIEPFITTGAGKGLVTDSDVCDIYSFAENVNVRSADARAILQHIEKSYREPFAVRWLTGIINTKFRLYAAVSELARAGAIEPHPMLVEAGNAPVAQAEAQLLVTKEGCEVITKASTKEGHPEKFK